MSLKIGSFQRPGLRMNSPRDRGCAMRILLSDMMASTLLRVGPSIVKCYFFGINHTRDDFTQRLPVCSKSFSIYSMFTASTTRYIHLSEERKVVGWSEYIVWIMRWILELLGTLI